MRFYRFSWDELCNTPIRVFWLLHKNMERARAGDSLRLFEVIRLQSADKEACEDFLEKQRILIGSIVTENFDYRDEKGIKMLKGL